MASPAAVAALKAHLLKHSYTENLESMEKVEEFLKKCYPSLRSDTVYDSKGSRGWVIVSCARFYVLPGSLCGPVQPTRIVFSSDGTYSFQVLYHSLVHASWKSSQAPHVTITNIIDTLIDSGHVLCPGIVDYEDKFKDFLKTDNKDLRSWTLPIRRYDSVTCQMWHKPSNSRLPSDSPLIDLCKECRSLYQDMRILRNRAVTVYTFGHTESGGTSSVQPEAPSS